MPFSLEGVNFGDARQRQSASDALKAYVGSYNPRKLNLDSVLRGYSGFNSLGRDDDNTFRSTLWNATNPGQTMANDFLSTPGELSSYRTGFNAFKDYAAGNQASLQNAIGQVENQKKTMPAAQGGFAAPQALATPGAGAAAPSGFPSGGSVSAPPGSAAAQGFSQPDTSRWGAEDFQSVARMGGYTGPMGAGQHAAWMDADPTGQRRKDYQDAAARYGAQYAAGGGVVPVGVVEPFNQWQKDALSGVAEGPKGPNYADTAGGLLNNSNAYVQDAASSRFNPQTETKRYFDPYLEDVVNATMADINRGYDKANNAAQARAARMGNMGSSSEAINIAENDRNRMSTLADALARLRSTGYQNAQESARSQFNTETGNKFQAANTGINVANAYQGLDDYNYQNYYDRLNRKLGAGGVVQGQNQKLLDAVQKEIERKRNYPYQQFDFYKGVLGAYPTGQVTNSTTPGNTMGGLLGGAMLGNYASDYLPLLFGGGSQPMDAVRGGMNAVKFGR